MTLKSIIEGTKKKAAEVLAFLVLTLLILGGTWGKEYIVSYYHRQEWSITALQKDAYRSTKIAELTTELRTKLDANSVSVFLFHNGGFFSGGIPFKKASVVYESVDFSTAPIASFRRDTPLSQLAPILEQLTTAKDPFYVQTRDLNSSYWKYLLITEGTARCYYGPLRKGDKMLGFVKVGYNNASDTPPNRRYILTIQEYSGIITSML